MPRVTIIVGLCGSGKSHLAKQLQSQGAVCLDESFKGVRFSADTGVLSRGKFDTLVRLLRDGHDCAYTDAMLMSEATRRQFEPWLKELDALPGVTVEWVFFENDAAAANHNCRNDPNRDAQKVAGDESNNKCWTALYAIPAGHTPRRIEGI